MNTIDGFHQWTQDTYGNWNCPECKTIAACCDNDNRERSARTTDIDPAGDYGDVLTVIDEAGVGMVSDEYGNVTLTNFESGMTETFAVTSWGIAQLDIGTALVNTIQFDESGAHDFETWAQLAGHDVRDACTRRWFDEDLHEATRMRRVLGPALDRTVGRMIGAYVEEVSR